MARRCTATSKQSGEQCKRSPAKGRDVCKIHGGGSLRSVDHPMYDHGRYDSVLGAVLSKDIQSDRLRVSSLAEIDVFTVYIREQLIKAQAGESPEAWADMDADIAVAQVAMDQFDAARRRLDGPAMTSAFQELRATLQRCKDRTTNNCASGKTWKAALTAILGRAKLVNSEVRRQTAAVNALSTIESIALARRVIDACMKHIPSIDARREIFDELSPFLGTHHASS